MSHVSRHPTASVDQFATSSVGSRQNGGSIVSLHNRPRDQAYLGRVPFGIGMLRTSLGRSSHHSSVGSNHRGPHHSVGSGQHGGTTAASAGNRSRDQEASARARAATSRGPATRSGYQLGLGVGSVTSEDGSRQQHRFFVDLVHQSDTEQGGTSIPLADYLDYLAPRSHPSPLEDRVHDLGSQLASMHDILRDLAAANRPANGQAQDDHVNDQSSLDTHEDEDDDDAFQQCPHLDLSIKHIQVYGKTFQTAPVLYQVGDRVLWKYGNDIMVPVEIMEVTMPSLLRRQPIYHIRFGNRDGSHDIPHNELFIPLDRDNALDPAGLLTINEVVPAIPDQLEIESSSLAWTPEEVSRWSAMKSSNFKMSTFMYALKDHSIKSDNVTAIEKLYRDIAIFLRSASRVGANIMLPLSSLSPSTSLRDLILPPPSYSNYGIAKACFDGIGEHIMQVLEQDNLTKLAPKAGRVLQLHLNSTKDGWEVLKRLLKERLPYLGASGFDTQSIINSIVATNGMLFDDLVSTIQSAQRSIQVSGMQLEPNILMKRVIQELMKCSNLSPLLSIKNHAFHLFCRQTGNAKQWDGEGVDTILDYLQEGSPPSVLIVPGESTTSDDASAHRT